MPRPPTAKHLEAGPIGHMLRVVVNVHVALFAIASAIECPQRGIGDRKDRRRRLNRCYREPVKNTGPLFPKTEAWECAPRWRRAVQAGCTVEVNKCAPADASPPNMERWTIGPMSTMAFELKIEQSYPGHRGKRRHVRNPVVSQQQPVQVRHALQRPDVEYGVVFEAERVQGRSSPQGATGPRFGCRPASARSIPSAPQAARYR